MDFFWTLIVMFGFILQGNETLNFVEIFDYKNNDVFLSFHFPYFFENILTITLCQLNPFCQLLCQFLNKINISICSYPVVWGCNIALILNYIKISQSLIPYNIITNFSKCHILINIWNLKLKITFSSSITD